MADWSLEEAWSYAYAALEKTLRRPTLARWLPELRPLSFEHGTLTVGTPNEIACKWLSDKAARKLGESLTEEHGSDVALTFIHKQLPLQLDTRRKVRVASPAPESAFRGTPLDGRYTFESFVAGKNCRLAHAAAMAVSMKPGRSYNPLFIYGGSGLGKTHLMQAIGHAAMRNEPRLRVVYVSGETFTDHVVTSIRDNRFAEFREAYRSVDLWLVDDVQQIAARERTEAEFFHAFNALYETGKQIVVTSDRAPKDLQIVQERLRSRFEWGLMADVKAPDFETRMAILEMKAAQEKATIPDDVIRYMATTIIGDIRTMEGALTRLIAIQSLTGEQTTLSQAVDQLRDYASDTSARALNFDDVQRAVVAHFGITIDEIKGQRRTQNIVVPRQVAMYLCRRLMSASFPEIARRFGGRDHSTVIYACNKLESSMKIDRQLRDAVNELTSRLQEESHVERSARDAR